MLNPPGTRSPWLPLVAILLLGALLRIALILQKGGASFFADTVEYDAAARALLAGQPIPGSIPRAPVYPAFLALIYAVAGVGNFLAVRGFQLVFGLGIIALIAGLGRRMKTPAAGLLAALGVAVAPTLIFTTTMLYPNILYTFLLLAATVLGRALATRPGAWAAIGFGIAAGVLLLTDPIGLAPVGAILLWTILSRRNRWLRRLVLAALALAIAFAPLQMYRHAQRERTGGRVAFFSKAQYVLWVSRHKPGIVGGHQVREPAADTTFRVLPGRQLVAREMALLRSQPAAYAHDYLFEFAHFFAPLPDRLQTSNVYTGSAARRLVALYFLPVLLFALVGLFAGGAALADRVLLALIPLATAAIYALFFTQMRYRIPTEPCLLLLAALGAMALWKRYSRAGSGARPRDTGPAPPPR